MSDNKVWRFELEEYIRQGEPDKAEKSEVWQTAIGLQDVDGLMISDYLLETAKEHIEGKIDIYVVQKKVQSYYEEQELRKDIEHVTKEADIVACRIAALLGEKTFQFSPVELQEIHRRLFQGVFDHAGKLRQYNITKKEWILKGDTVLYASYESIAATLAYDFNVEKQFSYEGLSVNESVKHMARFTSGIWQIHPFCEGNTRVTAVFIIKYLKTFGFNVNNDVFAEKSWYFRNALVRSNYNDIKNGVHETTTFLEYFFDNLLLNKHHDLKNRVMHIDYVASEDGDMIQSASNEEPKCQNGTLECTLEEVALLKLIVSNPRISQKELAENMSKSERTIKRKTVELQEKGLIKRLNGKRNGYWKVLIEL